MSVLSQGSQCYSGFFYSKCKKSWFHWRVLRLLPCLPLHDGLPACRACTAIQLDVTVPVLCQIPRFPGLGSESQSWQFFHFFSFSQLSATVNQWRKFFWITLSIDQYELVIGVMSQKVALTGVRTPNLETWNCLDWGSNPKPGNVELPWLRFEPQTWKHRIWCGTATPRCRGKEGKCPMMPIASHSVPMGVHYAPCSFHVKIIMFSGVCGCDESSQGNWVAVLMVYVFVKRKLLKWFSSYYLPDVMK